MKRITASGDWGELVIEQAMIDISTNLPQPDQRWTATDSNGHEHYWRDGYPTLVGEPIGEPYHCGECEENHQDTQLVCSICREPVEPGTYVNPGRQFMPGMRQAYLNGEPITGERAEGLLAQIRTRRDPT